MRFMGIGSVCLLVLAVAPQGFSAPPAIGAAVPPGPAQLDPAVLGRAPLRFEERSAEQWLGRGIGFGVGISRNGAIFSLPAASDGNLRRGLQLRFLDADPDAAFVGESKSAAPNNYFIGKDFRSADAFLRLRRPAIYPGIDLVYYGHGQDLEYDFELAAGADPARIRVVFDGADRIRLSPEGDLVITVAGGEIVQKAPVVYQRSAGGAVRSVASSYFPASDGSYAIRLGGYDASEPLVIDPEVRFTAYLAGTGADGPVGIGMDSNGTLYLAGFTRSDDFPLVGTAYSGILQQNQNQHVFTTKLNPLATGDDVIPYSGFFGSTFGDELRAMTVDDEGVFYLTGVTDDFFYPVTDSAYRDNNGNVRRMFFAAVDSKLPGESSLVYSTFFAGARIGVDDPTTEEDESMASDVTDEPTAIAVHGGHVYITGFTGADDFPLKNPIQDKKDFNIDAFVSEFDITQSGDDSLVNSTYLGGGSVDMPRSIDVDANGKVYLTGYTYSFNWPTTVGSYKPFYSGGSDVFLTRLDLNAAAIEYSTFLGTGTIEQAWKVIVDPSGLVAVGGFTLARDFPVTQNAFQTVAGGGGDVFLAIFDPDAELFPDQLVYSTFYGGSDGEVLYDMRRGTNGAYYLSGYTLSRDLPVRDALRPVSAGASTDGFVAIIDPSADAFDQLRYSSFVTGAGYQIANNIEVDPEGNVYVAGIAFGNVFDPGQAVPPENSNTNVFVLVFQPSETPPGASGNQQQSPPAKRQTRRR